MVTLDAVRALTVGYELLDPLPWSRSGSLWTARRRTPTEDEVRRPVGERSERIFLVRRFPTPLDPGSRECVLAEAAALEMFDSSAVATLEAVTADGPGGLALVLDVGGRPTPPGSFGGDLGPNHPPARGDDGVALASALAALHAAGLRHGGLSAETVVLVPEGSGVRRVLVDLGRVDVHVGGDQRADVVELCRLLATSGGIVLREAPTTMVDLARALHRARTSTASGRATGTVEPARAEPGRQLTDPAPRPRTVGGRRKQVVVIGLLCLGVFGVLGVVGAVGVDGLAPFVLGDHGDGCVRPAPVTTSATDASGAGRTVIHSDVDGDGCVDEVRVEAVRVGGRTSGGAVVRLVDGRTARSTEFVLGGDVGEVLVGDWDCDGVASLGLYRPATGEVELFDGWVQRAGDEQSSRPGPRLASSGRPIVQRVGDCDRIGLDADG